ncbi:hypothetical protein U1Q18_016894 [Sarracenia purpurea var. burkii]
MKLTSGVYFFFIGENRWRKGEVGAFESVLRGVGAGASAAREASIREKTVTATGAVDLARVVSASGEEEVSCEEEDFGNDLIGRDDGFFGEICGNFWQIPEEIEEDKPTKIGFTEEGAKGFGIFEVFDLVRRVSDDFGAVGSGSPVTICRQWFATGDF